MTLIATVLEIVAPVFLLAAVGFIWVKMGLDYRVEFVTRLAMTLSVPCLIFVALMETKIDPASLSALSMAAFLTYVALAGAVLVAVFLLRQPIRVMAAPLIFGNTGNLGLPLALFAFGEAGLGYAVVVFAIMAVLSFTFGVWLVSGGGNLSKVVKEPMVAATILGALFLWQGWETPTFLTNTLRLTGQMAIPLMLITLGVAVARLSPDSLAKAMGLSALKLALSVGIAWPIGRYFALEPVAFAVLVVQIATPVAVTSYLLAEKYGEDGHEVAGLVVASTLLSVGYLPLLLAVLI